MSVLFVVCQSIKIIPDVYEILACKTQNLEGKQCKPGPIVDGIVRVSHLMVCVNSSANFLIYYMCGSKFRKAWGLTYGPIWQKISKPFKSQTLHLKNNSIEMKGKQICYYSDKHTFNCSMFQVYLHVILLCIRVQFNKFRTWKPLGPNMDQHSFNLKCFITVISLHVCF